MTGRVTQVVRLLRPVRSLADAVDFYCGGLGFSPVDAGSSGAHLAWLSHCWSRTPQSHALLQLGDQQLELVELDDPNGSTPPDDGSGDPRFQHIAVVTHDMPQACARLWAHAPRLHAITRGGPQALAGAAAGITAFKFRDPDGHPVELLAHAAGQLPAHWQAVLGRGAPSAVGPTLGIDHSALCVADTDRAMRFYRDALGFAPDGAQVNRGPAQSRLDGLADAVVDVVGLRPAALTPHLEVLGYHGHHASLVAPSAMVDDRADRTLLEVDDLAALAARWRAVCPACAWSDVQPMPGSAAAASGRDPDGHALLLVQR